MAEHGHHAVAYELVNRAAMLEYDAGDQSAIVRKHLADVFWLCFFAKQRERPAVHEHR